jgi:hypothetical protein
MRHAWARAEVKRGEPSPALVKYQQTPVRNCAHSDPTREGEGGPPLALVTAIMNPGATLSEIDGEHHYEVSLPLDID